MDHTRFANWVTIRVVHLLEQTIMGEPNYHIGPGCAAVHNCNSWFSLILHKKKVCFDPSLEPSNEGSQCMFSLSNRKKYIKIILKNPSYLGLLVQSIVSLTSPLRGQLVKCITTL